MGRLFDLEIDHLRLTLLNGGGHEHRVASIAERAMALLADRMDERAVSGGMPADRKRIEAPSVRLDLNTASDEEAARQVAEACLDALAMRL
jgi:hypothetical protein